GRSPFRKFVVNYNVYRDSNPLFVVRTQVQLHETTNIIEIHSTNVNIPANFATVGIENATGTVGVPVPGRNDASFSVTNDYVAFIPDCVDIRYLTVSEAPTTADAGPTEIEQCDNSTFVMSANTPDVGTGAWTVVSGTATITNPTSPTTTIPGVPVGTTATLRWTISNGGCTPSFDDIDLINHELPSTADAGLDKENCNDGNFTMTAVDPAIGSGTWSLVSGTASITSPNAFNTPVTGVPVGTSATLEWRVENGTCAASVDQVVITNLAPPTTADAGPVEIEQCDNSTFVMSANTPVVGTGMWTVVSVTANITNPTSPTTTITGVPVGTT